MTSYIGVKDGVATSYIGRDATELFRVKMIKASIEMYKKHKIIPTRGVTISKLLAMSERYTGQKYKRGEHDRAIEDLTVWINTMTSALPIVEE